MAIAPAPQLTLLGSSYFLGHPPPDPRFLASLGTLSLVELDQSFGWTGPKYLLVDRRLVCLALAMLMFKLL
jgi:hypothetical protein